MPSAKFAGLYSSLRSLVSRTPRSTASKSHGNGHNDLNFRGTPQNNSYSYLSEVGPADRSIFTHTTEGAKDCGRDYFPGKGYPMNAIRVTQTVDLV